MVDLLFRYRKLGRPGRAWELLARQVRSTNDYDLTFQLGYLQAELGESESAILTLRALLDRAILRGEPVETALISNLVEAFNRAGRHQEAIDLYENVIHRIEQSGSTDTLHFNVGNAYLNAERYTDAIRFFEIALGRRGPNKGHILHNIGDCYYELERDDTALEYYQKALAEARTPAELATEEYALGNALLGLGRSEEATSHYVRAARRGHAKAKQQIANLRRDS